MHATVLPPIPVSAPDPLRVRFTFDYSISKSTNKADKINKSIQDWQAKLNKSPSADNHVGLGQALEAAGKYPEAEAEIKEALKLSPNNQYFESLEKKCHDHIDDLQKQLQEFGKNSLPSQSSSQTLPEIQLNDAAVQALNSGNYDLAVEKLKAALALDPGYKLGRNNLSIAFNNRGIHQRDNHQAALLDFERALLLRPDDADTEKNIEKILLAMSKSADSFEHRKLLGGEAYGRQDYTGALVEWRRALKLNDSRDIKDKITKLLQEIMAPGFKSKDLTVLP